MSTRAVIARSTTSGWEGVYQHSGGYPTGLGKELWASLRKEHGADVARFVRAVIDAHPGGWSHFALAVPAGKCDAYRDSGYAPDFFDSHAVRECYCHSSYFAARDGSCAKDSEHHRAGAPSGWVTYDPSADGAQDLKWAYCFGPDSLTVFAALPSDVARLGDGYQTAGGEVYQLRPYAWQVVGIFSVRGDEPDWGMLECGRNFERCEHLAWAHLDGLERERVKSDPYLCELLMRDYLKSLKGS